MKCTSCRQGVLKPAYLDDLFPCYTCSHCGGNWIYLRDYLRWLEKNEDLVVNEQSDAELVINETKGVMTCPKTGKLMLKYRISKDQDHMLDLSPDINGIWMDKGEWSLLKNAGLARHLNSIFTEPWQRKIRQSKTKQTLEALYIEEFGEEDYKRLKEIRNWIYGKANKAEYLAYLLAEKPYSAQ
ncbi:MAG: hypothetical protein AMJ53_09190 [Gammaproteobacteria bacterium SG8_11]|nr:MAG: hypothetical protein AMJ53_09190 [Gammaproteobacteria bacterium SG8_11]